MGGQGILAKLAKHKLPGYMRFHVILGGVGFAMTQPVVPAQTGAIKWRSSLAGDGLLLLTARWSSFGVLQKYQYFFDTTNFLHQNTYDVLVLVGEGFYLYLMKKEKTERTGKKQVGLEVTVEEKELAEKVAKERGLGFSALVRLLIKDEARRLGIL